MISRLDPTVRFRLCDLIPPPFLYPRPRVSTLVYCIDAVCFPSGVCILIFLFGDARQLYPYELARPKITSPMSKPQGVTIGSSDLKSSNASEKSQPNNGSHLYVDLEQGNHMSTCSSTSTFDHKARAHLPGFSAPAPAQPLPAHGEQCEMSIMTLPTTPTPFIASPTSAQGLFETQAGGTGLAEPGANRWSFDFDALPTSAPTSGQEHWEAKKGPDGKGIPTFGPLTKVLSPIVTRAQWEIVIRSAIMAVVVALAFGAICLAVPARR